MAGRFAALLLTTLLAAAPLQAQVPVPAQLRCRLAAGPWQHCRMALDADGLGWQLQIGAEQIRFRHDGRGAVAMERSGHAWQPVEARWLSDASLCWDGVCTRGQIPLD
ncbi:MAG: hypothetical protein VKM98_02450 [Cyanobacteriota bacterium]|nr:hypothetical protein [Cyanobacteriota bacterium]